jgi:hypothetical protein
MTELDPAVMHGSQYYVNTGDDPAQEALVLRITIGDLV